MNEVLLISGMAIATFTIRYTLFAFSSRIRLAPEFIQLLRYVPPAVLTAIVVPAVLLSDGTLMLSYENARLVGALVAIAVGVWRKNLLLTIVASMGAFLIWQGLLNVWS
jgi:branched-subunit amino acid transport protein